MSSEPDPPQRANAAQMASRKVKSTPVRRGPRRPALPSTPTTLQISLENNSVPQWADSSQTGPAPTFGGPGGGSNGGGLFGGAITGSSTFNFDAPQGMKMTAYTNDNPDAPKSAKFLNSRAAQRIYGPTGAPPPPSNAAPSAYGAFSSTSSGRDTGRIEDTRSPKRQFGMPAADTDPPSSNIVFGQSNPPFNGFGGTTPASSAPSFGSTTTQSQPELNMNFSTATDAAPNPSSPFIPIDPAILGSTPVPFTPGGTATFGGQHMDFYTPTPTAPSPAAAAPTGVPTFNFETINSQANPPSSSFTNASQAPASPMINFGADTSPSSNTSAMSLVTSPPVNQTQTGSIFGHLAQFGSPAPNDSAMSLVTSPPVTQAQTGNIFGHLAQPGSQAPNMFGSSPAKTATGGSVFGIQAPSSTAAPAPTMNLFGNTNQTPAPATTTFIPKPAETSSESENPFAFQPTGKASASANRFTTFKPARQISAAPSPFESINQASSTNSFSGPNKPAEASSTDSFTFKPAEQPSASANPFESINQASSTNSFSSPNKPAEASSTDSFTFKPAEQPSASANPFESINQASSTNSFSSPNKPAEASSTNSFTFKPVEQPAAANPFGSINQASTPASTNSFPSPDKPAGVSLVKGNIFQALNAQPSVRGNPFQNINKPSTPSEEQKGEAENAPPRTNLGGNRSKTPSSHSMFGNTSSPAPSKKEPLSSLNQPIAQPTPNAKEAPAAMLSTTLIPDRGPFGKPTGRHALRKRVATASMQQPARKAPDPQVDELLRAEENSGGMNKGAGAPREPQVPGLNTQVALDTYRPTEVNPSDHPRMFPGMNYASKYPIDKMQHLVPEHFTSEQEIEYYTGFRMIQLNRALARTFSRTKPTDNIFPSMRYYNTLREEILTRTSADIIQAATGPKRKAQNEILQENGRDSKRVKPAQASDAPSDAPALFQSQPQDQPTATGAQPQPAINGNSSQAPSFYPAPSVSRPASPSKNKRKGEELTKDDYESSQDLRPLKQIRLQVSNGEASPASDTFRLFQQLVDGRKSPRKVLPEKGTPSSAPTSDDDKPRNNPFAQLAAAQSQAQSTNNAATFNPSGGIFSPTKASQAPATTASVQKSDAIKPPIFAGAPGAPQSNGIKPPTFNATPVDFMSAFKKSNDDYEKQLMEKAKDEDYDSDDDEAEWEANYWKKREATKKKIEEDGKAIKVPTFGQPKVQEEISVPKLGQSKKPETRTFFGQASAPKNSGTSVFSSANVSRSSTPGAKSIFDGPAPPKPAGNNIFGHLSDSGGSAKANDADEDSDAEPEDESDSENRDPSYKYKPGEEIKSGPGTPVTPVEETGAGIASTMKPTNTFDFGAPKGGLFAAAAPSSPTPAPSSGTSTPVRSLFDRITRDSNGNPIRVIPPPSTEEKENTRPSLFDRITRDSNGNPIRVIPPPSTEEKGNTQPPADATKNLFSSLNNSFGSIGDQTWKSDGPIRFGASTPTTDGTGQVPAFNVQAATPEPAHHSLFGNTRPAFGNVSPISGGLSTARPAGVGFSFGAPSAGSSLLPSAVGSTNTSRATTPGGTTDGDSAVEVDPYGQHHEQINLTAGGPGEEDEEVVHEVRAKAFIYKEGAFRVKGVGPMRVLQHKDTKATRMILRADPNGNIVLNKALISQVYEAKEKTVKFTAATDGGNGFETWLLQVKTVELAETLAWVFESNKPSS